MSGVVTIPVTLPAAPLSPLGPIAGPLAPILLPVIAASAAAAAVSLGFAVVRAYNKTKTCASAKSVALTVNNAAEVTAALSLDQTLVFERDGVVLVFARDAQGQIAVRVEGELSEEELRVIGEQAAQALVQQYAYHRLVSELKARGMTVDEESMAADGTVHLKARVYQG